MLPDYNLLIDRLPTTVSIGGEEYCINSDFRTSILFELLMQDETVTGKEKIVNAIQLYYPEVPADLNEAVEMMLWFYACGKRENPGKGDSKSRERSKRIYSFEHDDDYIYSAFLSQYRMDLQDVKYLHWWKFRAMFNSLSDDNQFVKIMQYRSMTISADLPKDQKKFYERMKRLYALPVSKSEAEKNAAIEEALMNGGDLTGLL